MKHTDLDLEVLLKEYEDNDQEHDDLKLVEKGDWEIDYKDYAGRADIYMHVPTGRYVCINQSRSGSYYTEYNYDEPTICEVVAATKTVTVYEAVAA